MKKNLGWIPIAISLGLVFSCPNSDPYVEPRPNEIRVAGLSLSCLSLGFEIGAPPRSLVAVLTPSDASNKTVAWTSSAPSVASVDGGTVTPVSPGSAIISARAEDGNFTAECVITVVASMAFSPRAAEGFYDWASITSNADGSRLAACVRRGGIFVSSDSGATWVEKRAAGAEPWRSIVSSADGSCIIAFESISGEASFSSSRDYGATWSKHAIPGMEFMIDIALDADGSHLAAISQESNIRTSSDYGETWIERTASGEEYWVDVWTSADGSLIYAVSANKGVYVSGDGGGTWAIIDSGSQRRSIASSADGSRLAELRDFAIWTSTDSGFSWGQSLYRYSPCIALFVDPAGARMVAVFSDGYIFESPDFGTTWSSLTPAGAEDWTSIASSADGSHLAATAGNGNIWVSTDFGNTWAERPIAGSREWQAIASNSDGSRLAAVPFFGNTLFYSSDSGSTWVGRALPGHGACFAIASSSNGARLAVTREFDNIYASADYAVSWGPLTSADIRSWRGIKMDPSGAKIAAVANYGGIFISSDFGSTWTELAGAGTRSWRSITASSDLIKFAAGCIEGIFVSADSGASWTLHDHTENHYGFGIAYETQLASSDDGSKLAAVLHYGGPIITSSDCGSTWTIRNAVAPYWIAISSNPDGSILAAVSQDGGLFMSYDYGLTWVERRAAGSRAWCSIAMNHDASLIVALEKNGDIWIGR